MPLVRRTETGPTNYVEKVNTGGDICGRTAIRSYHKVAATSSQTEFTIPFIFEPGTYTLWVYVDGVKAEYVDAGDYSAPTALKYDETGVSEVTFYGGLTLNASVEFIVAGSYQGDDDSGYAGAAPDLSIYKTRDGLTGSPQNFITDQPMAGYKFTGLSVGGTSATPTTDSVRFDQLGAYTNVSGVHYHCQLWNTAQSASVIDTSSDRVDITGAIGAVNITGTIPTITFVQSDSDDVQWIMEGSLFSFKGRQGVAAYADIMTTDTATLESTFHADLHMNGGSVNHQISGVLDGTDAQDVATFGQLGSYRGTSRSAPVSVYSVDNLTPPLLGAGLTVTYDSGILDGNSYTTVGAQANGLMFRVSLEINQSGGVLGIGENHDLALEFTYNSGSNWERVAFTKMADGSADINNTIWNDVCVMQYATGNNNNFRFRWVYNRSSTVVTNPLITVKVENIGWYR